MELLELFQANEMFKEVDSFDKTFMGKMALVEHLDKKEKTASYAVLDIFPVRKD